MSAKHRLTPRDFAAIFCGAMLMGLLWRVRGTNGWGSSWGLLNAGVVFLLFLNTAVGRRTPASLPLIALSGGAFMLTVPAWGTYLDQITGYLSVRVGDDEPVLYEISPASGVIMMLILGFGLASIYGVLLGRAYGEKAWRFRDYALVLLVFIVVDLAAKARISHFLVKAIEPQAVTAFQDGLKAEGLSPDVYAAYMSHFSAVSWAKKLLGGRNSFSSVGTVSLAIAAVAVILTARFAVKDKYAAKTGAFVCGAFAVAITIADLFFYFGNGGYRMAQGFSLPDTFAPWSLWEYFTGFLAGGMITAWLIKTSKETQERETLLSKLPDKAGSVFSFLLCAVVAVGLNVVRPVLVRNEKNIALCVFFSAFTGIGVLAASLLYRKKKGRPINVEDMRALSPALALFFVLYITVVYLFIGRPEITNIRMLHTVLVVVSAVALGIWCVFAIKRSRLDPTAEL